MKTLNYLSDLVFLMVAALALSILTACAAPNFDGTPASPAQQAITAGTNSYKALDAAILAADAAVKNGSLKGQDARNALTGFTQAKAGLDVGLVALRNANAAAAAASGVKP